MLQQKRDKHIDKLNKSIDETNTSKYAQNSNNINLAMAKRLPDDNALFDQIFDLQESKKDNSGVDFESNAMQQGGDNQMQQLITMYAQIVQQDPNEIAQQLQALPPEQQQQAIQQMMQTVQQQGQQEQQQNPQEEVQQQMQYGGTDNQSMMGYRDDSPYRFNKSNMINSNYIDMDNTGIPLIGISNTGDTKIMKPYSGKYKFNGNQVKEIPMVQYGKQNLTKIPNPKNPSNYFYIDDNNNYYNKNKKLVDEKGNLIKNVKMQDNRSYDFMFENNNSLRPKGLQLNTPVQNKNSLTLINNSDLNPSQFYIDKDGNAFDANNKPIKFKGYTSTNNTQNKNGVRQPISVKNSNTKQSNTKQLIDYNIQGNVEIPQLKDVFNGINANVKTQQLNPVNMRENVEVTEPSTNKPNDKNTLEKTITKNKEGLKWYNVAGDFLNLLDSTQREQVQLQEVRYPKLKLNTFSADPQINQIRSNYNTAISNMNGDSTVGSANIIQALTNANQQENQALTNNFNQNVQIQNQESIANQQIESQQINQNQNLRNDFNTKVTATNEAQRQQQLTSFQNMFDKVAKYNRFDKTENAFKSTFADKFDLDTNGNVVIKNDGNNPFYINLQNKVISGAATENEVMLLNAMKQKQVADATIKSLKKQQYGGQYKNSKYKMC